MKRSATLSARAFFADFGEARPPFFVSQISAKELAALCEMGGRRFDPSLILGVASRCRFGGVRVLTCAPVAINSAIRPFPTTFWLVCPWLLKHAGTVESNAGVRQLEKLLLSKTQFIHEWRKYNLLHQIIRVKLLSRVIRQGQSHVWRRVLDVLRRGGIGGINYNYHDKYSKHDNIPRVKCLHLQTASFLALRHHPASDWLTREGLGLDSDCNGRMCDTCCTHIKRVKQDYTGGF